MVKMVVGLIREWVLGFKLYMKDCTYDYKPSYKVHVCKCVVNKILSSCSSEEPGESQGHSSQPFGNPNFVSDGDELVKDKEKLVEISDTMVR